MIPKRCFFFFFQAEDGIRDATVTGVQTCALPISARRTSSLPAPHRPQRGRPAFVQPDLHPEPWTNPPGPPRVLLCGWQLSLKVLFVLLCPTPLLGRLPRKMSVTVPFKRLGISGRDPPRAVFCPPVSTMRLRRNTSVLRGCPP